MSLAEKRYERIRREEEEAKLKMEPVVEAPVEEEPEGYPIWIGTVACNSDALNVRKGPGTEFENLEEVPTVKKGSTVEVVGESGEWYNVKVGDSLGFVMAKFISK